jgi:hypothetical protein
MIPRFQIGKVGVERELEEEPARARRVIGASR